MRHSLLRFVLAVLACGMFQATAQAHGLHLFVAADGDVVRGKATYSDGKPAVSIEITVSASSGETVANLTTDELGVFEFVPTKRGRHVIVADGGDGHRVEYVLEAAELPVVTDTATDRENADLESLINDAMSRQIVPLREQLDEHDRQVRIRDIIGGIGYIVGIMGLIIIMKTRKGRAG